MSYQLYNWYSSLGTARPASSTKRFWKLCRSKRRCVKSLLQSVQHQHGPVSKSNGTECGGGGSSGTAKCAAMEVSSSLRVPQNQKRSGAHLKFYRRNTKTAIYFSPLLFSLSLFENYDRIYQYTSRSWFNLICFISFPLLHQELQSNTL